jgi:hypothetical protein
MSSRLSLTSASAALGVLGLMGLVSCTCVDAATFRVDDTGTVVSPSFAEPRWMASNGRGLSFDVEASARVNVRLNLAPWQGKSARIFLVSPKGNGASMRTRWTGSGVLLSGSIESGARALVWSGKVTQPQLADALNVVLRTDGRSLHAAQSLEFAFEIDLD